LSKKQDKFFIKSSYPILSVVLLKVTCLVIKNVESHSTFRNRNVGWLASEDTPTQPRFEQRRSKNERTAKKVGVDRGNEPGACARTIQLCPEQAAGHPDREDELEE
jgi:hypothetical protein